MITKLLNIFFNRSKSIQNKSEVFLSNSKDHYDLDYRIKYLDDFK